MTWTRGKEEEENVLKKRLLYDGNGSGDDKRLVNLLRNLTKFCLTEDANGEDMAKAFNVISKDLTNAQSIAEKHQKISIMCEKTFECLERSLQEGRQQIETVKKELISLELDLEYAEKLKKVNEFPDCQSTELAIADIEKRRQQTIDKLDTQRMNIKMLLDVCENLKRILNDNEEDKRMDFTEES